MIVSYRAGDHQEPEIKPKKVKLYNNRAYIEALKERIVHDHNVKIEKALKMNSRASNQITVKKDK